jgi:hypothetical protein
VNRILHVARAATSAAAVIVAAGALTVTPAFGAQSDAGSGHLARSSASGGNVLPGQPMIPAGPSDVQRAASGPRSAAATHSVNWSGYAATRSGKSFSLVQATFFVPYLNCAVSPGTYSADWVGFDGFSGKPDSVEQTGIEADCLGSTGESPVYRAWYEMYPKPESVGSIRVRAGDSVTARVSYSATHKNFRLTITDHTNGQHFAVTKACVARSCPRNSAQVISEAPASNLGQILPLADYGAVSFINIAITDGAGQSGGLISRRWRTTKIIQVGDVSRNVIAQPTAVYASGFANYWHGEN